MFFPVYVCLNHRLHVEDCRNKHFIKNLSAAVMDAAMGRSGSYLESIQLARQESQYYMDEAGMAGRGS